MKSIANPNGILLYKIAKRRGTTPLGFAIDFIKYSPRWPYRPEGVTFKPIGQPMESLLLFVIS